MVVEKRLNPEIGLDGETLDSFSQKDFTKLASLLRNENLSVTLHAPFFDLCPGAMDSLVLKASRDRLRQVFDLVPLFEPETIVCHTGYDNKRYHDTQQTWLEIALDTWKPLVKQLGTTTTTLVFENVYEKTPQMLLQLLTHLKGSHTGFCFDTGHMNTFSETDMEGWLKVLGPFIKQLHLHDNDGSWDQHWAIGDGNIPFEVLFRYLNTKLTMPVITIEAHREDWLWQSLERLSQSIQFMRLMSKRE
jgi:sugar phosphate isomerase/epimerase